MNTKYTITLDTSAEDEWEYPEMRDEIQAIIDDTNEDYFRIDGENLGWTHASGFTVARRHEVIERLTLNADFRIDFMVDESQPKNFKAMRYSHDEPVGASFTIRPATYEEWEDYVW